MKIISKNVYCINVCNLVDKTFQKLNFGVIIFYDERFIKAVFSCLNDGFYYQNITDNAFMEFQNFRDPLEKSGWRFQCNGALKNVHPSAMQISTDLGVSAYVIEKGSFDFKSCNIFDVNEDIQDDDTVENQNKFWDKYIKSPSSYVNGN